MMLLCLLFVGTCLALPTDEFRAIVHEGDLAIHDDALLKQIIPSGYSPQISSEDFDKKRALPNVDIEGSAYVERFFSIVGKGVTEKGLIFNLYDDDMRNAAVTLFRLLIETRLYNRIDYDKIREWAKINLNNDMYDYVTRLVALYSNAYISEDVLLPPFYVKPNYFFNGETIVKALYIKNNFAKISDTLLKNYQAERLVENIVVIDSNYSGWNIPLDGCDEQISYFKDDVALNSYYYGIQLLHPFWMSNEELDEINPKHAEHYYFAHQQLLARYRLEKEHLGAKNMKESSLNCESDYNPYLYYDNGLAFPTRSCVLGDNYEGLTHIKSVDIAIKECIQRGLVIMNGTFIKVTPENYINLMTKLIRANLDGIKSAKIIRSIFGYGNNGYPINKHNPTPSVLHHPQTTLRDPVYWLLMEKGLDYFSQYTNHTAYDLSEYETDEFNIEVPQNFEITTVFQNSHFNLEKALDASSNAHNENDVKIFARQRRLTHMPFVMNFTINSKTHNNVIVRLFLGPQCGIDSCWNSHLRFFELDCYRQTLEEGVNIISWNPETSNRFFTYEENVYVNDDSSKDNYNIYKYPRNLVIPKGLPEGLNLTAFIMVTEDHDQNETTFSPMASTYQKIFKKLDNKPLGFPFHKQVELSNDLMTNAVPNYKFFNISIFHNTMTADDKSGYFSPHLY